MSKVNMKDRMIQEAIKRSEEEKPHKQLGKYVAVELVGLTEQARRENLTVTINNYSADVKQLTPVALPEAVVNFIENEYTTPEYVVRVQEKEDIIDNITIFGTGTENQIREKVNTPHYRVIKLRNQENIELS